MTEQQHDDWNPWDASILRNQRQAYDKMREHCSVAYSKFMGWSDEQWQFLAGWGMATSRRLSTKPVLPAKPWQTCFRNTFEPTWIRIVHHRAMRMTQPLRY